MVHQYRILTTIALGLTIFTIVNCKYAEYGSMNSSAKLIRFQNCIEENGGGSTNLVPRSNSEKYKKLNRPFQLKPPRTAPQAFAVVSTENDVVVVVRCGLEHKIRLVPKGGGHSFEKYSFGDSESVVVDLQMLNKVTVDKSSSTATVGAGNLVGPLTWKLWKAGKALLPTAASPTIGISGVATGGGYNYFSRMYGLATDSIMEANIVTADGVLLTVNNTTNSELFWALRGGVASCFGIVTKFVFRVYPAPRKVFKGLLQYALVNFTAVFNAWDQYISNSPKSVTTELQVSSSTIDIKFVDSTGLKLNFDKMMQVFPNGGKVQKSIHSYKYFITHETEALHKTPGTNEYPHLSNVTSEHSLHIYQFGKSFYVKGNAGSGNLSSVRNMIKFKPLWVFVHFQQYGGAINDLAPEETAFVHRGDTRYLVFAVAYYTQPEPIWPIKTIGNCWVNQFFELGKTIFNHQESYQNYVDEELPNYLQRYYGSNLAKLVAVKDKYDPENYFQNPQCIPAKL